MLISKNSEISSWFRLVSGGMEKARHQCIASRTVVSGRVVDPYWPWMANCCFQFDTVPMEIAIFPKRAPRDREEAKILMWPDNPMEDLLMMV